MPLPDERPRQSVANLIGRFEKQKPPSNGPPPAPTFQRTSSVASHRTGDSAVEELKEKREWPPRRTDVVPPTTTETPSMPNPGKEPTGDPDPAFVNNEKEPEVIEAPRPEPEPSPDVAAPPSPPIDPAPVPTMPPKTKSTTSTPSKTPTARTPAVTKPPTLKSATKPVSAVPQKSTTNTSASGTPLKPQTAGQSVSSTRTPVSSKSATPASKSATPATKSATPATKSATPATKSATPAKHVAAVTPARAKTPSTVRARSPSVRSKTPSSGLFAPTAASLARAKNAPAPAPAEKSKRKITTDLSKPTAASASKVRTPVPVPMASPPKVTKTPAPRSSIARPSTGTSTVQATAAKPVAGKSAAKASTATVKNGNASVATVSKTTVSAAVVEHVEQGDRGAEEASRSETTPIENYDDDFLDDTRLGPEEHIAETHEKSVSDGHPEEHVEEPYLGEADEEEAGDDVNGEEIDANGHVVAEPHVEVAATNEEENISHEDDMTEEETIHAKATPRPIGSDLDDLVNMLETVPPIHRPGLEPTATRSVSDAGEIPDEY